jgi:hypothetical protein
MAATKKTRTPARAKATRKSSIRSARKAPATGKLTLDPTRYALDTSKGINVEVTPPSPPVAIGIDG